MTAAVITAYVPIPDHPRSEEEYMQLRNKLFSLPILVHPITGTLEDCWLYRYLNKREKKVAHSVGDNPKKNSLNYHIVQAQKPEWLALMTQICPQVDTFVWIDCGIFHLPGMTGEVIVDFMHRVDGEQSIAIPGCWPRGFAYSDENPVWRFCGGVIVMPRQYAWQFFDAVRHEYIHWIELHNRVTWDVNTLARLEERDPELPLWWYRADHNASLFTHYQPTGAVVN